jgi:hypothetical protein
LLHSLQNVLGGAITHNMSKPYAAVTLDVSLLEDAVDSVGGGVLFIAEGARVAEFVAAAHQQLEACRCCWT